MRLRVLGVFILLLLVPLTTFATGYRLGNRNIMIVRADAPVIQNGQEMMSIFNLSLGQSHAID